MVSNATSSVMVVVAINGFLWDPIGGLRLPNTTAKTKTSNSNNGQPNNHASIGPPLSSPRTYVASWTRGRRKFTTAVNHEVRGHPCIRHSLPGSPTLDDKFKGSAKIKRIASLASRF